MFLDGDSGFLGGNLQRIDGHSVLINLVGPNLVLVDELAAGDLEDTSYASLGIDDQSVLRFPAAHAIAVLCPQPVLDAKKQIQLSAFAEVIIHVTSRVCLRLLQFFSGFNYKCQFVSLPKLIKGMHPLCEMEAYISDLNRST